MVCLGVSSQSASAAATPGLLQTTMSIGHGLQAQHHHHHHHQQHQQQPQHQHEHHQQHQQQDNNPQQQHSTSSASSTASGPYLHSEVSPLPPFSVHHLVTPIYCLCCLLLAAANPLPLCAPGPSRGIKAPPSTGVPRRRPGAGAYLLGPPTAGPRQPGGRGGVPGRPALLTITSTPMRIRRRMGLRSAIGYPPLSSRRSPLDLSTWNHSSVVSAGGSNLLLPFWSRGGAFGENVTGPTKKGAKVTLLKCLRYTRGAQEGVPRAPGGGGVGRRL